MTLPRDQISTNEQRAVISALVLAIWVDPAAKRGFNRFDRERVRIEWRLEAPDL